MVEISFYKFKLFTNNFASCELINSWNLYMSGLFVKKSVAKIHFSIHVIGAFSHIDEYASEYSEYESLKFAVNSLKNCE